MASEWLPVRVRGWGGAEPTATQFFELIGLKPEGGLTAHPSDSPYRAAIIELFALSMDECQSAAEPTEEFDARLTAEFERAAEWLNTLSPDGFAAWRAMGKVTDVFIGGWTDADQFDQTLPAEFLLACGRLGLPIVICTND